MQLKYVAQTSIIDIAKLFRKAKKKKDCEIYVSENLLTNLCIYLASFNLYIIKYSTQ